MLIAAATVVAALQIGYLGVAIVQRAALLRDGQEILLRSEPISATAFVGGDDLVLSYEISRLPVDLVQTTRPPDSRPVGIVYVRLRQDDGASPARATAIGFEQPVNDPPGPGELDLRGESATAWQAGLDRMTIRYGLERLYLPEGLHRGAGNSGKDKRLAVQIAVGETGEAQIKAVLDDGVPLYREPLY